MIYFLIPIYNEEGNIKTLAHDLKSCLPQFKKHFVLVNDASTDNSGMALREAFHDAPHIILTNKVNSGPGTSFNVGFNWILDHADTGNDLVVTMEGDNTCDLSILPLMVELQVKWHYDIVLASVYAQGGGFSQTNILRKLLSALANILLRLFFDIKVLTLTSFYRVYSLSILHRIRSAYPQIISESGFICKFELLIKGIKQAATIIEVPMVLKSEKRIGQSKMKLIKTARRYISFLLWKRF